MQSCRNHIQIFRDFLPFLISKSSSAENFAQLEAKLREKKTFSSRTQLIRVN